MTDKKPENKKAATTAEAKKTATKKPTIQEAMDIATQQAQDLQVIDEQYGDNLPYDKTRVENEISFYLNESANAMLEAGKRLVLLKEHEMHGEFTKSLGRIGLEPRTARRMITAALKYDSPKRTALSVLGKTKLFELMTEDDEDLDTLADGGTLAGKTLDEIDKMTSRELKETLRKEREKAEQEKLANDKLTQDKNAQLDDLSKQVSKYQAQASKKPKIDKAKEWEPIIDEMSLQLTIAGNGLVKGLENFDLLLEKIPHLDIDPDHREAAIERIAGCVIATGKQLTVKINDLMTQAYAEYGMYEERMIPTLDHHIEEEA